MANEFSTELLRIQLRTAALAEVLPSNDKAVNSALASLRRVLALEDKYKGAEGWYAAHVPLFIQMQNCIESLVNGKTLTEVRGNGLIKVATDSVRTNGCGLGKCMGSIEAFLGVPNKAKREVINSSVYPVLDTFEQSKVMIERMYESLIERSNIIEQLILSKQGQADAPEKEVMDRHLVKRGWTDEKIKSYSIEYIARLFANSIDADKRKEMIENVDFRLTDALDTLRPRFIAAAA